MIVNYMYDGVNFCKKNAVAVTFDEMVIIHFGSFPDGRKLVLDRKKLTGLNVIEQKDVK